MAQDTTDTIHEVPLRLNDGRVEFTIPVDVAKRHGIEHTDPIAFWPDVEGHEVGWHLTPGTDDLANARAVRTINNQSQLRFPTPFASERGLFTALEAGESFVLELEERGDKHLYARLFPGSDLAFYTDTEPPLAEPSIQRLATYSMGPDLSYLGRRLDLPVDWEDLEGLPLSHDADRALVAFRITAREGQPALMLDFDLRDDEDEDSAHVRTFYKHDLKLSEGGYHQWRVTFAPSFALGLGLSTTDKDDKVSIRVTPEKNRLLIQRTPAVDLPPLAAELLQDV